MVNVPMFFKLPTLHWSTPTHADRSGGSPESRKECNALEETESTADAWEIQVAHLSYKTPMMVSGTWSVTPPSGHQTAALPPRECGPRTSSFTTGSCPAYP